MYSMSMLRHSEGLLHRIGSRLVVLSLLAIIPVATSDAQRAELRAGARVKIRAPGVVAGLLEGVILDVQRDTLSFAPVRGAPLPIAVAMVTEAHVYRGKSSRAGMKTGALWGGGIGLALGAMSASFSDSPPETSGKNETGGRLAGVVAVTVVGVGIGALVGGSRGADQWERLTLP